MKPKSTQSLETRAIHAGAHINKTSSLAPPIFQTSTFKLANAAQGAEFIKATAPAEFYTRWGNPTTKQLEAIVADLEGSEAALAFSSGMGAISAMLLAAVSRGEHLIVGKSIYSGVSELVGGLLARYGVECSIVDVADPAAIESAIRKNTRMIFVETPSNPTMQLCDLAAIAAIARRAGILTAVDNTFATPVNQSPLALGFDISVHAATKYIGGHSDATAGILCASKEFIARAWYNLKLLGASLSPFESWLLIRGLKTLPLRVERQNASALELAGYLEGLPEVEKVHYPGLESHPQRELARRQMRGFGGMVSFELKGGYRRTVRFVESLRIIQLAVSLGGVESLIQHPASMTHGMLPEEEIRKAGISTGLLRFSVGLEHPADLKQDIEQALHQA